MSLCIFCEGELEESTKPEHILLNALGGRMTTKCVICSDCNNLFGGGIDKALTDQATMFRNLLQLESGSGRSAPSVKNVKAGKQTLHLRGDGQIELVAKPFTISPKTDGSFDIQIQAGSVEEIENMIPHIAASLKMPEQRLRDQLAGAVASIINQRPDTIIFSPVFGGPEAIRSAVKSCLILWATHVGNNEVSQSIYKAARDFVTSGDDLFNRSRVSLDSRLLPNVDTIAETYGPVFNVVYVRSDENGRVVGHFTLYNLVAFQVVLAESGGTLNSNVGLASNPVKPQVWTGDFASQVDVPFSWLSAPEYTIDSSKKRIGCLMDYYFKSSMQDEWGRIIEHVFQQNGLQKDTAIPVELAHKISGEIALRVTKHQLGLPHEEKATFAEMQERAAKNRKP